MKLTSTHIVQYMVADDGTDRIEYWQYDHANGQCTLTVEHHTEANASVFFHKAINVTAAPNTGFESKFERMMERIERYFKDVRVYFPTPKPPRNDG